MRVVWTDQAKDGKNWVANYIRRRFGYRYTKKFMQEVDKIVGIVKQQPNIGSFEPLLADLPTSYRSIVVSHLSKIVYYVNGDIIYIVDFWDVRREPDALASQVKGLTN